MPLCEICAGLLYEAFSSGPRFAVTGKFCHAGEYAEGVERCGLCQYIHDGRTGGSNDFVEKLKHLDKKEILEVAFGKLDRVQPSGFVNIRKARRVRNEDGQEPAVKALLTFSVREGPLARLFERPLGSLPLARADYVINRTSFRSRHLAHCRDD